MTTRTGEDATKSTMRSVAFLLVLMFLLVSSSGMITLTACARFPNAASTPGIVSTKVSFPTLSTPAQTPLPTPTILYILNEPVTYNQAFLERLGTDPEGCLPDKTAQHIGVYIYDLDNSAELVSINADIPFQFASSFKGPVLTYFLSSCQKIWDSQNPEWDQYFTETAPVHESGWYQSAEYRQKLTSQIYNVAGWEEMEALAFDNRPFVYGESGPIDKRYFILHQVYSMVTESSNQAAGNVLNFVFRNCLAGKYQSEAACGGPNALTEFNAWFNNFAGIKYGASEVRRGLYYWDTLVSRDEKGNPLEQEMPTFGLADICAFKQANLSCASELTAVNVYTPRDLFQFYYALFHLQDHRTREVSLEILGITPDDLSRGYLKNLAVTIGAEAMSKNGRASYSGGAIMTDAGILRYQGKSYVIVTLSYNAVDAMEMLYGSYLESGFPANDKKGLIQLLLEGRLPPDGE